MLIGMKENLLVGMKKANENKIIPENETFKNSIKSKEAAKCFLV